MINTNKSETTERLECSADTKLFFDDVYTNSTRTKKAQVETVQCGRSMIEMLGVLAIVGVLSVGGIAGYSKAMTKFKINKTTDQISQIVTNIRTLYAQQTTYNGLNFGTAVSMGVVPDEVGTNNSATLGTNPFGGQVAIFSAGKKDYTDNEAFVIGYGGLPKEACVTLATYDWGTAHSSGFIGLSIQSGSNFVNYDPQAYINSTSSNWWGWSSKSGPMTISLAAQKCSEQDSTSLTLKFY